MNIQVSIYVTDDRYQIHNKSNTVSKNLSVDTDDAPHNLNMGVLLDTMVSSAINEWLELKAKNKEDEQ